MKKAHIISIGNELLIGDTVNTNASWLGRSLSGLGFFVEQVYTIPDDYTLVKSRIAESLEQCSLTVVTGGLGPTHDDITKKAVADLFGAKMIRNEAVLGHVKSIFARRKYVFSAANAEQAMVPENCEVLFNDLGTAPGMWFEKEEHYLVVLPGVPYEMQHLMNEKVRPKVLGLFPDQEVWVTEYFKTAGIPESMLSDELGNLEEFVNNGIGVAFLPNPGGVTLRISTSGSNNGEANERLKRVRERVQAKAGDFIFTKGRDTTLAEVVGEILAQKGRTLAVAESCTGGLLSNSITDIAGSSRYMAGGVIAYSNAVKISHLGVSGHSLETEGAVSKIVALQMAKGVAEKMGADIGLSTTGIAGPGGGTGQKPVGTVWMGFWISGNHFALHSVFTGNRLVNKERTVMVVLETLRRYLLGIPGFPYNLKPEYS